MAKYKGVDIDFSPPDGVRKAYRRGIELYEGGKGGSGLEQSTVRMARKLASGDSVSPEWARKGYRFWSRNERFLDDTEGADYTSAMLWGGRPGMTWFRSLAAKMDRADEGEMKTNKVIERDGKYYVTGEDGKGNLGDPDGYATREEALKRLREIEYFKTVSNSTMVNLVQKVNAADIKIEMIDNEEHYVIPSATLPDDVVMNGGLYTAEEIEKSYMSLNGVPAPVSHPMINGKYVSARDVRAINQFHVGAYVDNVRREGGRVYHDTVVNKRVAMQTDKGRELIQAIEKGEPIHTSTGIFLTQQDLPEAMVANKGPSKGKQYTWLAKNMTMDHNAILLNEPGAATPAEGVGMMVNGEQEQEFAVLFGNLEQPEPQLPQGWLDKIVTTVTNVLKSQSNEQPTFEVNAMSQLLKDKLTALHVNFKDDATEAELLALHTEAVIAANQVDVEALKAEIKKDVEAEIKANAEAEAKADLVSEIQELKGNTLTEDELKASPLAVLKQIKSSLTPKGNATVLPSPVNNSSAQVTYDEMPD